MKILTAGLPSLMLIAFAVVLALQAPDTHAGSAQEIQKLRSERKLIAERLEKLEAAEHHVLPRGGL